MATEQKRYPYPTEEELKACMNGQHHLIYMLDDDDGRRVEWCSRCGVIVLNRVDRVFFPGMACGVFDILPKLEQLSKEEQEELDEITKEYDL